MKVKEIVEILPSMARVTVSNRRKELLRMDVTKLFKVANQTHSVYREEMEMEVAMLEAVCLNPLWFVIRVDAE